MTERGGGERTSTILHIATSAATTSYGGANYGMLYIGGGPRRALHSIVLMFKGRGAFECRGERDGDGSRHVA